jgi:hypothetical protein
MTKRRFAGKTEFAHLTGDPFAQEHRDRSAQTARVVAPPANRSTTSDDELEWLQIGMGLGAGVALGFGLFLGCD